MYCGLGTSRPRAAAAACATGLYGRLYGTRLVFFAVFRCMTLGTCTCTCTCHMYMYGAIQLYGKLYGVVHVTRIVTPSPRRHTAIQRHTALYEHTAIQHHTAYTPYNTPQSEAMRWCCVVGVFSRCAGKTLWSLRSAPTAHIERLDSCQQPVSRSSSDVAAAALEERQRRPPPSLNVSAFTIQRLGLTCAYPGSGRFGQSLRGHNSGPFHRLTPKFRCVHGCLG